MDVGSSSDEGQIFSSSSEEMEDLLEFIEVKSKRGSSLLTRDGFEYQFERYSAVDNQVEHWKCPKVWIIDLRTVRAVSMSRQHGMKETGTVLKSDG
uniref:Uncharacterized protein n=1 Tax=Meloidogyne javanica TaxID=6303 RepID=A0A915LPY1_MELJA